MNFEYKENAKMNIEFEKSFELLPQEEWDSYLSTTIFDDMRFDINTFIKYKDRIMLFPRLGEATSDLINKVGELLVTYSICKHYYDKGIPDDPWYGVGENGTGIRYFPEFQPEHHMRRFWFNYFASGIYLRYFSYWDGIIGLLNIFYGIDETVQDYRFRQNVMANLKTNQRNVYDFLKGILNDPLYNEANEYRTCFVHGKAPSEVANEYVVQKDVVTEIPTIVDGKLEMKKGKALAVLSARVGDYVNVKTVMKNIEAFATFTGQNIQALLQMMV